MIPLSPSGGEFWTARFAPHADVTPSANMFHARRAPNISADQITVLLVILPPQPLTITSLPSQCCTDRKVRNKPQPRTSGPLNPMHSSGGRLIFLATQSTLC